jgi:SNF2 family DNA or RNA helicase
VDRQVLVFTQFRTTLSYLQSVLPSRGYKFGTLSGDMTRGARTQALENFAMDPSTTVFLMSIRAGAVGINLTQANHIFLFEPCLNPATELQAIGRVWR